MKAIQLIIFLLASFSVFGQQYDILLKGGHVIDPKNGLDEIRDIALENDKIVLVEENIPAESGFIVVDVSGMYVVPGLIDLHSHNFQGTEPDAYLSNSFSSLAPDGFTFRVGVTTTVDAGCAGWKNFKTFKNQTIDRSKTRVLAFINIVGAGMRGGAFEQNLNDMDAKLTAMAVKTHSEDIVGVKLAHYSGEDWTPVERAVEAGEIAGVPVMIDFGRQDSPLSLQTLFFEKLRPGDIFTHAYAAVQNRMAIVDEHRKLRPFVMEAQERGIIFDVGHGGGSFFFNQAIPAVEQGLKPNTISTDLHTGSMNAGMKDINNVMSKFLNMGLSLQEVIAATTSKPAEVINRADLGHLSQGGIADIAVLKVEEGDFGFVDVRGWRLNGDKKIVCEMTIRNGQIVYDLNGISRPIWEP